MQVWTGDSSPLQQALSDYPAPDSTAANGSAAPALKDTPTIVSHFGPVMLADYGPFLRASALDIDLSCQRAQVL